MTPSGVHATPAHLKVAHTHHSMQCYSAMGRSSRVLLIAAALLCLGGVGRALAGGRLVEKPLVLPGVQVWRGRGKAAILRGEYILWSRIVADDLCPRAWPARPLCNVPAHSVMPHERLPTMPAHQHTHPLPAQTHLTRTSRLLLLARRRSQAVACRSWTRLSGWLASSSSTGPRCVCVMQHAHTHGCSLVCVDSRRPVVTPPTNEPTNACRTRTCFTFITSRAARGPTTP